METPDSQTKGFKLNLLGAFELRLKPDGSLPSPIDLSAKKSKALLTYLALSRDGCGTRDRIAHLLWSNTELTFAKTNLRQCLSTLRKQVDNKTTGLLKTDGDQIAIDLEAVTIDIDELYSLENEKHPATAAATIAQLPDKILLTHFPSIDPEFDQWLQRRRVQHQERYRKLLEQFLDTNNPGNDAIREIADELLLLEPENEKAHLWLVNYHLHHCDRLAALRQYETCRTALATHLDVSPGPEITALYESIIKPVDTAEPDPTLTPPNVQSPSIHNINTVTESYAIKPRLKRRRLYQLVPAALLTSVVLILVVARLASNVGQAHVAPYSNDRKPVVSTTSLPARPAEQYSIAVIPFRNLNEGQDNAYLSDGISEDLVTEISRVSGLTVIASQSSFHFRDREDNLEQLKQNLPVDYLLTGSVRRSRNRLRINVHLIRTKDNTYVWSEKLDREMEELLQAQDEITRHIVSSLSVELTESEWQRLSQHREVSPEAYDLLLRGLHPFSQFTEEGVSSARHYFLKSIEADPDYARPYANLALSFGREVVFQFAAPDQESIRLGLEYATTAERLDPSLPQTQFARAVLYLASRDHVKAVEAARKSIALDPNYADGFAVLAQTLAYKGELDAGLEAAYQAKFLNPVVPFTYKWVEGHILYQLKRYDEASALLEEVYASNPSFYVGLLTLTATYGQLGDTEAAEWINEEIQLHQQDFSAQAESEESPYLTKRHREHLRQGLIKAGLPE